MVLLKMKKNLKGVKAMYKRLVDFYNVYDENDTFHNGFLQSIDLSAYTDIPFLNEITLNLMDAFLRNEIGNMLTSSRWSKLLEWDKTENRYVIKSEFYNIAKDTIYTYLIRGKGLYTLINNDFRSLSASETEQIIYGQKEELKDYDTVVLTINRDDDSTVYGQEERTLQYGLHEIETGYGQIQRTLNYGEHETETEYGQLQRTLHYGQHVNSTEYGNTSETTNVGQQVNSSVNVNQTHPYDMNDFLDNTKDTRTDTNGTRQDSKTTSVHTDTNTSGVHEDSDTTGSRTDTTTDKLHTDTDTTAIHNDTVQDKQHTDTDTTASKTDVNKYGDITHTTDNRQDKNTIKTHTDQKTRTKVILIPPEKYFEIQKELLSHNVYDIMKDCVKECFTIHSF